MDREALPLPWRANVSKRSDEAIIAAHVIAANGNCVCQASLHDDDTVQEVVHLFAAAPELLEGAEDTVEALRLLRIGLLKIAPETIAVIDAHIDELSYAIRKARGEGV